MVGPADINSVLLWSTKAVFVFLQVRRHQQCAAPAARTGSQESVPQVRESATQVGGSETQVRSFEGAQNSPQIDLAARLHAPQQNAQESPRSQLLVNQLRAQLVTASNPKP